LTVRVQAHETLHRLVGNLERRVGEHLLLHVLKVFDDCRQRRKRQELALQTVQRQRTGRQRHHVLLALGLVVESPVHLHNVGATLPVALAQQRGQLTLGRRVRQQNLARVEQMQLRQRDGVAKRVGELREHQLRQMHVESREPHFARLVLAHGDDEHLVCEEESAPLSFFFACFVPYRRQRSTTRPQTRPLYSGDSETGCWSQRKSLPLSPEGKEKKDGAKAAETAERT
jgi:hypothetical protein